MSRTPRSARTDGEVTRSRILETAGELFASTGFAETTSKMIASAAEVDVASINYHFGSRSGLYQAVLVEAHRRFVDLADLQRIAGGALSGVDKLNALIDRLVQRKASEQAQWHLHVLAREILSPSSHIQVLFDSELLPKLAIVRGILGEITGIPGDDPALVRCMLSVAAPCLMLLIASRGVPGPLQEVLHMPREDVVGHLQRFALAGLEAVGREHALRSATRQTR